MDADRLAPWYRSIEYAAFGHALERCRFAFIDRLAPARRVLLIGEGDGRLLARLLTVAPDAVFDVIDSSAAMLALARTRAGNRAGRVRFRHEDILAAALGTSQYDAVGTFFLLDCFREAEARRIVAAIEAALAPGGILLHGDFALPERGWRRTHAQAWLWIMYRFFGLATGLQVNRLPAIPALLAATGLQREHRLEQRAGLVVSEVYRKPLR